MVVVDVPHFDLNDVPDHLVSFAEATLEEILHDA